MASPASPDHKRLGTRRVWLYSAVALALVGVTALITAIVVAAHDGKDERPAAAGDTCNTQLIAARTVQSVVTITISSRDGRTTTGSGVILDTAGHVLTNNHVIAAVSARAIQVRLEDGTTSAATIAGRDPLADLAVLALTPVVTAALHPIPVGSSARLHVGQFVIAVGSPLGLSGTVTAGIVSALNRSVDVPIGNGETARLVSAVQTDAAINPGNSGGALVDCTGTLIGIPTAGAVAPTDDATTGTSTGNIGLGFAIPSDLALAIAHRLITNGTIRHSYTGLQTDADTSAEPQARVTTVDPDSPAQHAGLQAGDIIASIGNTRIESPAQLQSLTLTLAPGRRVTVTYRRGGHTLTTRLTLGSVPIR